MVFKRTHILLLGNIPCFLGFKKNMFVTERNEYMGNVYCNTYSVSETHALSSADQKNCDLWIHVVVQSETQNDPQGSNAAAVFPAG